MSGSKSGHTKVKWKGAGAPPESPLLLCMMEHLRRKNGVKYSFETFPQMVPGWRRFYSVPVSDDALRGRIDTQCRGEDRVVKGQKSYSSEQPEVNKYCKPFWGIAGQMVKSFLDEDEPFSNAEIRCKVSEVQGTSTEDSGMTTKRKRLTEREVANWSDEELVQVFFEDPSDRAFLHKAIVNRMIRVRITTFWEWCRYDLIKKKETKRKERGDMLPEIPRTLPGETMEKELTAYLESGFMIQSEYIYEPERCQEFCTVGKSGALYKTEGQLSGKQLGMLGAIRRGYDLAFEKSRASRG